MQTHAWLSTPVPDYLGPRWRASTIFLTNDDGGVPHGRPDVAVLVHEMDAAELVQQTGMAALWLPGFVDTFFHVEHAAAWREAGVALVGLDMRRGGRALRDPRYRDDVRDLRVRHEEVSRAVEVLRGWGAKSIVLIGHSTGGLQAALFAADHPGVVDAVVLNSPWLDHNGSDFEKTRGTALAYRLGKLRPRFPMSVLQPTYARSLHSNYGGEFSFDLTHKPADRVPVFAGFFRAVRMAQAEIADWPGGTDGPGITEPVLVAHSDVSGDHKNPSPEELAATDVVLNVADMVRLAPRLGPSIDVLVVPGGRHDLALSAKPARTYYTTQSISWALDQVSPRTRY